MKKIIIPYESNRDKRVTEVTIPFHENIKNNRPRLMTILINFCKISPAQTDHFNRKFVNGEDIVIEVEDKVLAPLVKELHECKYRFTTKKSIV